MSPRTYDHPAWATTRQAALERDNGRCTIARIIGGPCSERLDIHHLVPVADGGAEFDVDNVVTVCSSHHPQLEALRRYVLGKRRIPPCRHRHYYDHARRECLERRLAQAA